MKKEHESILDKPVESLRNPKEVVKDLVERIDPVKVEKAHAHMDMLEKYENMPSSPKLFYRYDAELEEVKACSPFLFPLDAFCMSLKKSSGKYPMLRPISAVSVNLVNFEFRNDFERRCFYWGEEYSDILLESDVLSDDPYHRHPLTFSGNLNRFEAITTWHIPAGIKVSVPRKVILAINHKCKRKILYTANPEEEAEFNRNKHAFGKDLPNGLNIMTTNEIGNYGIRSTDGRPRFRCVAV